MDLSDSFSKFFQLILRFFIPSMGIAEDPATGSAQSSLVPYWYTRLNKTKLISKQLSDRTAEFKCEWMETYVIEGKCWEKAFNYALIHFKSKMFQYGESAGDFGLREWIFFLKSFCLKKPDCLSNLQRILVLYNPSKGIFQQRFQFLWKKMESP